jgi:hypothetical protein
MLLLLLLLVLLLALCKLFCICSCSLGALWELIVVASMTHNTQIRYGYAPLLYLSSTVQKDYFHGHETDEGSDHKQQIVVAKVIVIVVATLSGRYMPWELLVLGFTLHSSHLVVVIHSGGKQREGKN